MKRRDEAQSHCLLPRLPRLPRLLLLRRRANARCSIALPSRFGASLQRTTERIEELRQSRTGAAGTAGGTTTHVPPCAAQTRKRTLLSRATRPIWRVFAEQRDDRGSGSSSPGGQIGLTVTV